jgi:hypothetical protein
MTDTKEQNIMECKDFYPRTAAKNNHRISKFVKKGPVPKYHEQLFRGDNTINCKIIQSIICIKDDINNLLRINLSSPIFNTEFNTREISKITYEKNKSGGIDLVIQFKNIVKTLV